ncbi:hypothetical protein RvY_18586 [Ramazzottius varieornatus]|uniref:Uncharacterized protein n=1 Tax=Ramazzottius varieornatus TaxID=947166 RepID=A0A1D1VPZ6_RAMVA|nr:hypothetical protein RvY_13519 [Ramazzottius varieornatus]GAV08974.1 hypothetical protein RvY_18586 [Ramazzottius varieornatus]
MAVRLPVQVALLLVAVSVGVRSKPPALGEPLTATSTIERNRKLAVVDIPLYIGIAKQMVKLGKDFLGIAFNKKSDWTDVFGHKCQYRLTGRFCYLLKYRFIGQLECKGLGNWDSADCLKRKDNTAFEVPYRGYVVALCRAGKDKVQLIRAINNHREIRQEAKADVIEHLHANC